MRKYMFMFAIIIFMGGIAVTVFSSGQSKTTAKSGILNVRDVQADPDVYKGLITITGVVARFSKEDPELFAMIDTAEAKNCKSTGCAGFYLPVKFDKTMPKKWDEINVTGHFIEKGGLLFEAQEIEILRHLKF